MAAPTLHTVFQDGTKHNPATVILGFTDSTQTSEVDTLVRIANLKRMQQVGELVGQTARSLTDRVQVQKRELFEDDPRTSREILDALSEAANGKMTAIEARLDPHQKNSMHELWGHARIFAREAQTPAAMDRMIIFFHKFNAHLDVWQAQYPDAPAVPDAVQIAQSYQETNERLKKFIVPERLTQRFQAVVHPQAGAGFNTADLTQMGRCLGALHESQRTAASLIEPGRVAFSQFAQAHLQNFSVQRFLKAEEIAFRTQFEADLDLNLLWDAIATRVPHGPNPPRTAAERRAWMNDPQNAPALRTVAKLGLVGLKTIPPEIQRLTSLRRLGCFGDARGRLTTLPPEIANIPGLWNIALIDHNFSQIPEVLQRFRGYNWIVLIQNEPPITAFPEIFACQYSNGLISHIGDALWGMLRGGIGWVLHANRAQLLQGLSPYQIRVIDLLLDLAGERPLTTWQYFGIRPETLTDIPFSTWFRDHFSIPYIPVGIPILFLYGVWGALSELLSRILWDSLATAFKYLTGALAFSFIALCFLVNLPIFLLNLFINWAIVPIVELFRSCLGYSSMVHIDP